MQRGCHKSFTIRFREDAIRQVAALPYRTSGTGIDAPVSILLVTSRETRRWVIPKGNPMGGVPAHAAAAIEAEEEAGVRGAACPTPLGSYRYRKKRRNGASLMLDVDVFPLAVTQELDAWKESQERERRWFSLAEAAEAVEEPGLADLIRAFGASEIDERRGLPAPPGGATFAPPPRGPAARTGEGKMDGSARAPGHLWIVGIASALWNAFGCFNYLVAQTGNFDMVGGVSDAQRAFVESFPLWSEAAWALGVWGALAGSLLLLLRSRWAVAAFLVSLLGLAGTAVYQFVVADAPAEFTASGALGLHAFIWGVAIGLLLYAIGMRSRGVLR